MTFAEDFSELNKNDASVAGGKGASLGEMTQAGIPVPEGFVILSTTFDRFLEETDLTQEVVSILATVDHKATHTVESASEKIRGLIEKQDVPEDVAKEIKNKFKSLNSKFVAVRSSATAEDGTEHAWAGQLDSFLNTTEEDLLDNVKKCWSSLFTSRAIFYRFEKSLHAMDISVAVVVQKMIQSEMSGIVFSVHPVTENRNQLIIEAGFGLGEAIVSGQVTPDSYVIEKDPRKIIDVNVSDQKRGLFGLQTGGNEWKDIEVPKASSQVLNEEQILELAELIVKIENHYGFPCDIEWAFEDGKFYITQSRPITTLVKTQEKIESDAGSKTNIDIPPIHTYQRLFQVGGFRFFMGDVWMTHYKKLKVLVVFSDGVATTYLPKDVLLETLDAGLDLLSSEKFEEFDRDFRAYIEKGDALARKLDFGDLSKEGVVELVETAAGLYPYYSHAEFFYTDKAFMHSQKTDNEVLKKNIKKMESFKNDGREFLTRFFFGNDAYLNRLLDGLSKKFFIPVDEIRQYAYKELLSLFNGERTPKDIIDARSKAFYVLGRGDHAVIVWGDEGLEAIKKFSESKNVEKDGLIKGISANGGKVTGSAYVITYDGGNFESVLQKIKDMKQGEILVAETTSPEFMVACQKASAIVTDQGGLLSHAAIVSREMGIPCVVATENATRLIKNGDLLEVDGSQGAVRILKLKNR